jgi:DNA-binding MarR family transcriptional regulator
VRVQAAIARQREIEAWAMRCEGYRQSTIAEKLGVDESTVSKTLARVEDRVLADLTTDVRAYKLRVTSMLWTQYEHLRLLYAQSREPKRSQRMRRRGGLLQEGRAEGSEAEILESKIEEQIGDVAVFREMRATLDQISKLWGLYAPTKVAPTTPDGEALPAGDVTVNVFTDDERARRVAAALQFMAAKNITPTSTKGLASATRRSSRKRAKGAKNAGNPSA